MLAPSLNANFSAQLEFVVADHGFGSRFGPKFAKLGRTFSRREEKLQHG